MIIPAADEQTWSALLGGLPAWEPPSERMLVVAPHPDDETLGAGGLIAYQRSRGVEVTVAAVTDGERAYADSRGLGETRVLEQAEALLTERSLTAYYDEVALGGLKLAAEDTRRGAIDRDGAGRIVRSMSRLVRTSLSVGRASRLKKPPGNEPEAENRSR